MKLYYDNLVAYMPDSVIVDGKPIKDTKLEAARRAMMHLSDFQNGHDIRDLYESIKYVCVYSDVNIVDLMLTLKDINIDEQQSLEDLLDIAAKNLFQTVSPNYDPKTFDYRYYTAILMYVAHEALVIKNRMIVEELYKQHENGSAEQGTS